MNEDLVINGIDFNKRLEEARWKVHRLIELKCYVDLDIHPSVTMSEVSNLIEHQYSRIQDVLI